MRPDQAKETTSSMILKSSSPEGVKLDKICSEKEVFEVENSKNAILRKTRKLFVKLYFKWSPSLSYLSHRWISTESKLFTLARRNFRCFSSQIQQKLKIENFDPNLRVWDFLKILFSTKWSFLPDRITRLRKFR